MLNHTTYNILSIYYNMKINVALKVVQYMYTTLYIVCLYIYMYVYCMYVYVYVSIVWFCVINY